MKDTKGWKHRAYRHERIGKYLFQINIPVDVNIPEFEVVAFDNGTIKARSIFWDSVESHQDGINNVCDYLLDKDYAIALGNPSYFDHELGHEVHV